MHNEALIAYIAEQVRGGVSRTDIKDRLLAVGWSDDEADVAYASALISSGVPVPNESGRGARPKRASAVEGTRNFFSFVLLGIVTTALGVLYFGVIDHFFADTLNGYSYNYYGSGSIHYAISALVVGYPLYYLTMRLWFRKFREDEGKTESSLTKILTYLALLIASLTIVGDLIATVYTFLQGEISARFFLKALTILIIAGMIFGFYFLERRKIQYRLEVPRRVFQLFGAVLTGLIVIGITLGFMSAGTPESVREVRFDEQRASELANLAGCINSYAQEFEEFPETLEDLGYSTRYGYCSTEDPETGVPYTYNVVIPLSDVSGGREGVYSLCATFTNPSDTAIETDAYYGQSDDLGKWYEYTAGVSCDTERVRIKIPTATGGEVDVQPSEVKPVL
jgi:hypothetical protein